MIVITVLETKLWFPNILNIPQHVIIYEPYGTVKSIHCNPANITGRLSESTYISRFPREV